MKRVRCTGKAKYKTIEAAWAAVRKLKKNKGLHAHPYKCQRCHMYHVGKPTCRDNPMLFWHNIYVQMSEHDRSILSQ